MSEALPEVYDLGFAIRDFLEGRWISTFEPTIVGEDGRDWEDNPEAVRIDEIDISDVEVGELFVTIGRRRFRLTIEPCGDA